jgi:Na+/H+ antiporter NhaD/arsenite permease-like protein
LPLLLLIYDYHYINFGFNCNHHYSWHRWHTLLIGSFTQIKVWAMHLLLHCLHRREQEQHISACSMERARERERKNFYFQRLFFLLLLLLCASFLCRKFYAQPLTTIARVRRRRSSLTRSLLSRSITRGERTSERERERSAA